jgi:nucleoid DNA-binding protein
MKPYYDLTEAVELVSRRSGVDTQATKEVLYQFFVATAHGISSEGKASYKGLGGFSLKKRKARKVTGFGGKVYEIPERYTIHFNPEPDFVEWVNDGLPKEGPLVSANQD